MKRIKTERERLANLARVKLYNAQFVKREGEPNLTIQNCPFVVMTLKEVATILGVTMQCVQQTERRALYKVRKALEGFV